MLRNQDHNHRRCSTCSRSPDFSVKDSLTFVNLSLLRLMVGAEKASRTALALLVVVLLLRKCITVPWVRQRVDKAVSFVRQLRERLSPAALLQTLCGTRSPPSSVPNLCWHAVQGIPAV